MNRLALLLFAIALHAGAMAQISSRDTQTARDPLTGKYFSETVFTGRIVDSLTRQPLPAAVISVVGLGYVDKTAVRQYIADKEGRFRFTCRVDPNNRMEINHLGHRIRTVYLKTDAPERDLGDVWLAEDPKHIDAVVVRSRLKMYEMKGDTIVYIPKAVKTMEGEKALEILRQMPGVEVSDGGGVTIFGKAVERTYVNSRLLFGEDPTTALKQLEAEEVASIHSYDEVDEKEAAIHGKNARKRKVLNVVTFKDFSRSLAANAHAEAGTGFEPDVENNRPTRYNVTADAGYYSETLQVALSGGSDNLARHTLGNPLPGLERQSNASASISGTANEKHRYDFSYGYDTKTDEQYMTAERNDFPSQYYTSRRQADTTRTKKEDGGHSFNASYSYSGKKTNFSTSLGGGFSNQLGRDFYRQQTTQDGLTLIDLRRQEELRGNDSFFQWSGQLNTRVNEKQSFSSSINIRYNDASNNRNRHEIQTENEKRTTSELIFRNAAPAPQIDVDGSITYGFTIRNAGKLSLATGIKYTGTDQRIRVFDAQTDELDPALSELANDRTLSGNAGINYLLIKDKHFLRFNAAYQLLSLSRHDCLRASPGDRIFHQFLASVIYNYSHAKGTTTLELSKTQPFLQMQQFSSRLDDANPLNLSAGNPSLDPEKVYNANISHNGMIGQQGSFRIAAYFSLTDDAVIRTRTYFEEDTSLAEYNDYLAPAGATLWRPQNSGNKIDFQGSLSYKTRIAPLKCFVEFEASYNYSNPKVDLGQGPQRTRNQNGNFEAELTTNFSSKFRITVDSKTDIFWYRNPDGYSNRTLTERVGATLRWDIDRFFLTGNYTYGIERNNKFSTADNDTHLLNLSLGCRFWDRNATLAFNAYDILNRQTGIRISQSATGVSVSRERLYSSYFTFAFEYKFNRRK